MTYSKINLHDYNGLPHFHDGKTWAIPSETDTAILSFLGFASSTIHLLHPSELEEQEASTLFRAHFSQFSSQAEIFSEKIAQNLYLHWASLLKASNASKEAGSRLTLPQKHIVSAWLKNCLTSELSEDNLHALELFNRLYITHIREGKLLFYQSYPCPEQTMILYFIYQCIQELHLDPKTSHFQCWTESELDTSISNELQTRIANIFLGSTFEGLQNLLESKQES